MKDEEGNDIQMFIKEDKRNGLRKDSSFYYNGYWEVMEKDEVANMMTNKYDDTITHDLYFWKDSRLVKTVFNGVERNFIYGKTLRDTIK